MNNFRSSNQITFDVVLGAFHTMTIVNIVILLVRTYHIPFIHRKINVLRHLIFILRLTTVCFSTSSLWYKTFFSLLKVKVNPGSTWSKSNHVISFSRPN